MPEAALEGVKVVELSGTVAGAYCAKLLADFGAEVIKVEEPGVGDPARRAGPFPGDAPDIEKSGLFLWLNTSKKSITLNLKSAAGTSILKELARDGDVLVEDLGTRALQRLGMGSRSLRTLNPRLILTSISYFGKTGPYRKFVGKNIVGMAMGGLMYITGDPKRAPLCTGGAQAENFAAWNAFVATLGALSWREQTGKGLHLDVSAVESVASNLEYTLSMYSYMGVVRRRWHSRHHFGIPHGEIYPCKDGYVVACVGSGGIPDLAVMMEQPELMENPLFQTFALRAQRDQEFNALVLPWFLEHTRQEIMEKAQELRMPFAPVFTVKELLEDRHLKERRFFGEMGHPRAGRLPYPGLPFGLSETPGRQRRAPLLGEHNREVYCGMLGYSREELALLRHQGIV